MNRMRVFFLASFTLFYSTLPLDTFKGLWKKTEREVLNKNFATISEPVVTVTNARGPISICGWERSEIVIDAVKEGTPEEIQNTNLTWSYDKETNSMSIIVQAVDAEKRIAEVALILHVPEKAVLEKVHGEKGDITVEYMHGDATVTTGAGDIFVKNIRGSLKASVHTGLITIQQKTVSDKNFMLLDVMYGNITLSLPHGIHADIQARTIDGTVTCDHWITLESQTTKLNKDSWSRFKREAVGVIGTKEKRAKITADCQKGNIAFLITKKNE